MKEFFTKLWEGTKKVCATVGKRNWIIILCVFAVGLAVYLNFVLFAGGDDTVDYGNSNMADHYTADDEQLAKTSAQTAAEYFASTVLDRQRARDEAIEVLQTVVASADALETTKEQALADISAIAAGIEMEANIETLVKSKGFSDCIAVISGKTVNVIVKSDGLLPSEVAQIKEIVYETTGTEPANIKIIEKSA
ncbi:MAG: SpoIIIAH-like family protein [Eubacteriales bacterium]|nr:SpoIIIAH-like family protein [Eubacteriales bacterium]